MPSVLRSIAIRKTRPARRYRRNSGRRRERGIAWLLAQRAEPNPGRAGRSRGEGIETDASWISIRGPLAQQANALKALEQAMKPFADVTAEQGMISVG
jgi:hypothetical protein